MKELIKKFFDKTFLKFIIVGVANTLFGTAVMFVFYNVLHLSYWVSSASNYIFGSILSYFLNKYFTFKSRDNSLASVLRFAVNISVCYLLAYGLAKNAVRWVLSGLSSTLQDNIAMLVGMGLFVVLNYIGQRYIVFRADDKEGAGKE